MNKPFPDAPPERPARTARVTRMARRHFAEAGFEGLAEFSLKDGLRADLFLMNSAGLVVIVEVKSSLEDYRADAKWRGYAAWCDRFYFAVDLDFPLEALPDGVRVVRVDAAAGLAAEMGAAPQTPLAPARRKALTLRLARVAAERLRRLEDPGLAAYS